MDDPRVVPDLVHGVPPVPVSSTSTRVNKTGSWKYIRPVFHDRVAPCNQACPVGIDVEGYMSLLRDGRVQEAVEVLLRENPLPAVTGRVCYHRCENACNRRDFDEAVSIHAVERMLGDQARAMPAPPPLPRTRRESIGIVGSGPAGLTCAYHLVRLGYGVTIYEAEGSPGGILRYGIPEYRLPKAVLDDEIERIRSLGVTIRCHTRVGEDVSFDQVAEHDAVFVATGVHRSRPLGVPGEDLQGVQRGLEFLRDVNRGLSPRIGRRVVVVGGGNTAMDCARTALRLGADVTVLYRRTRAEMPAHAEEVEEAMREGVAFEFLAAPVEVRGESRVPDEEPLEAIEATFGDFAGLDASPYVAALRCMRMQLGPRDASGRRRPLPIEGSTFDLAADMVLTALGEEADLDHLPPELRGETVAPADVGELSLGPQGNVSVTRWRGDDPLRRESPVNEVAGRHAIHTVHFDHVARLPDRVDALDDGRTSFGETNLGLTREQALAEARRCFNCAVCNSCEVCLIFCPDVAITRREGGGFDIDYTFCKGCGVCAAECPRGAITMTREGL